MAKAAPSFQKAMTGAAIVGPTTRDRFMLIDCIEMALLRSAGGTVLAVTAWAAGPLKAYELPMAKAKGSRMIGRAESVSTTVARAVMTVANQRLQVIMIRLRGRR